MLSSIKRALQRFRNYLLRPVLNSLTEVSHRCDATTQILLQLEYKKFVQDRQPPPQFKDIGFRSYSQTDEDGILLFLFSVIGVSNKTCIEICAGDGVECNTANLILNHGWFGLLVDGNKDNVARGIDFYRRSRNTWVFPPRFICSWVTRSNINDLIKSNGFTGEIDLLSIDMDGVDYWIWEAIEAVSPRVVVVEYQDILGPERACTVPYSDDFCAGGYPMTDGMPNFSGASLPAFVKLARRKGYRLVGTNRYGYNAFFVRDGIADDLIPAVEANTCFSHPKVVWGMRERLPTVKELPWVDV
jgi:hypothetical protein